MRYIIGIDLGTTNSCVAYVDTADTKLIVQSFKIPQLVAEGSIEALSTLPSYCYLSAAHEWPPGTLQLPWSKQQSDFFVGGFAREYGAKVPTHLVQSAKSWLCHTAANRRDKILPLEVFDETMRISPLEATARYLRHIRDSWNHVMACGDVEAEFDAQEVVLTVPASFDEVARTLTVEAARLAGYDNMTLLEEPQAAFYSWIAQHESKWSQIIPAGSCILVCDVGGGTTDFSLIEVVEKDDRLAFQRMAVGDHLLLGGDNMDAAIAHRLEAEIASKGHVLTTTQRLQLTHEARQAKETLLHAGKGKAGVEEYHVLLQGTGSSVVQGTLSALLKKEELQDFLSAGFFGQYSWSEALQLKKTAGLRSMGLPYEDEPSITKHMAHFLSLSGLGGEIPKKPDFVLFNGGAMKPQLFQEAVVTTLRQWFPEKQIAVLESYNLDQAVARGAAYYGKVRRGHGVRIGGGMARGFYLVLDTKDQQGVFAKKALTLLPRGSEEGAVFEPSMTFQLTPNTPVAFQLCTSHVRLHDTSGELIDIDPKEMQFLPQISTVLRFGRRQAADTLQEKIPVHLQIRLTPIGTLQMELKSLKTEHQWSLEFQVRTASGQENSLATLDKREADQTFSSGEMKDAEAVIRAVFEGGENAIKPERLMEKLEEAIHIPRREWPPSLMRALADVVLKLASQRKLSVEHAARWWNLIGFLLRPGFGYPLDDFRMKELWKIILNDFKAPLPHEVQIQLWICYRRVAGGLVKGQQLQIANELLGLLLAKKSGKIELKSKADIYPYSERVRAAAALELIDMPLKVRLGQALIHRMIDKEAANADFWALGRLGARHLLYGSLVNAIPKDVCELWIGQLVKAVDEPDEKLAFLLGQLARKTEQRELNVSQNCVDSIFAKFIGSPHLERLQELLQNENRLNQSEQDQAFGDHLPAGLLLEV